jgi:SAM-dependent methyltransferase/predicted O-methyltransferase YrrM
MAASRKRTPVALAVDSLDEGMARARAAFARGAAIEAFDLYEMLATTFPAYAIPVLAELYECYRRLPQRDRYSLYVARLFDFDIHPGDRVLDIGSGHLPFPHATHLADITLTDHGFGRAGVPFARVDGKEAVECSVESMPFADRTFDFVYCSHVLEHVDDPERACRELMRVARRGYIETPTRGKDVFLNTARVSNHRWSVTSFDGVLCFDEYADSDLQGLGSDVLMDMHTSPQTDREKAFSALIYLRAESVNTMFPWDAPFTCEVHRRRVPRVRSAPAASDVHVQAPAAAPSTLRFLQVHTFYESYVSDFYRQNPGRANLPYDDQVKALVADGFSGIHLFAPYLSGRGYESHLVIANNLHAQRRWLQEQGGTAKSLQDVVRLQIERIRPDVLYLSDPITFDGRFLQTLSWTPRLILGWRAANIPADTTWRGFDLMLSSLSGIREAALRLGAREAAHFFPGYPAWINREIRDAVREFDVVFSGQWTEAQHPRRNAYLTAVAAAARTSGFRCGLFLSGETAKLPPEVARYALPGRFGVAMHRALRSGHIALDARGNIGMTGVPGLSDLAGNETANMRIFEVTGSGTFLLTEHHANLPATFTPGVEVETFSSERELLDKIRHYLAHPDEREAIARRGQERCLREYSMDARAAVLDELIRSTLAKKDAATHVPGDAGITPASLLEEATRALAAHDAARCLELTVRAKAFRRPVRGMDLVRARAFLALQRPIEAAEALREELRLFPGHAEAEQLLERLDAGVRDTRPACGAEDEVYVRFRSLVRPHTMLSDERLWSLYSLARQVCERNIPGNFVECGVAAGGSSVLLALVIRHFSRVPRTLYAFDSFEGMPDPTEPDGAGGRSAQETGWGAGTCAAPERSLRDLAARAGVDDLLVPVKGLFEETLPRFRNRVGMLALLHLDGDWYSSTKAILDNLYDRLVDDAVLQFDDYGHWDGCRKAVSEFEQQRDVRFALQTIDYTGRWASKPERFSLNPAIGQEVVEEFVRFDPSAAGITSQMSRNERLQLYYLARTLVPSRHTPMRFVEIGSFAGASLVLEYAALKQRFGHVQGFAVEPGGGAELQRVLAMLGGDVVRLPEYSTTAHATLRTRMQREGWKPDLLVIDGDHTYEGVRQDILNFVPLVEAGGMVVFHDYLPPLDDANREAILAHHAGSEPGVRRACDELMKPKFGCTVVDLPVPFPADPSQTQAHLPIVPGVFSTLRVYQKPR